MVSEVGNGIHTNQCMHDTGNLTIASHFVALGCFFGERAEFASLNYKCLGNAGVFWFSVLPFSIRLCNFLLHKGRIPAALIVMIRCTELGFDYWYLIENFNHDSQKQSYQMCDVWNNLASLADAEYVTCHNKTGQLFVTKKNVIFLLSERAFY